MLQVLFENGIMSCICQHVNTVLTSMGSCGSAEGVSFGGGSNPWYAIISWSWNSAIPMPYWSGPGSQPKAALAALIGYH